MSIDETIAEYVSLYNVRKRLQELSREIGEWVKSDKSSHLSDEEVADLTGWELATVQKHRKTTPVTERQPTTAEKYLPYISPSWQDAKELYSTLSEVFGHKRATVRDVLKQMETDGLIESKGKKIFLYGRRVTERTHFRAI